MPLIAHFAALREISSSLFLLFVQLIFASHYTPHAWADNYPATRHVPSQSFIILWPHSPSADFQNADASAQFEFTVYGE